ncbi:MAG: flippase [Victivallales bacterium]|nr:flippase [Victivallales bacterium]
MKLKDKLELLNIQKGVLRYIHNTFWQLFAQILKLTSALFIGALIARYLGPAQLGILSFSTAFVGIFSAWAPLGVDSIVIRELVKHSNRRNVLLGTAFLLKIIAAAVVFTIILITVHFMDYGTETNIIIAIVAGTIFFQSFFVINIYFQSQVAGKYLGYSSIINISISCILKIIFLLNNASVAAFAWLMLFDNFSLVMCYLFFYHRMKLSVMNWRFSALTAKLLLKSGLPLMLGGVVILIYMRIDQVMIKLMLGNSATGQYSIAVNLSEAWYFIPATISSSLFPAIINARKNNLQLYNSRMQKLFSLIIWISLAFIIPMVFWARDIVHLLYGSQYSESASVLAINAWAGIFVSLGSCSAKWFIAENLQRFFFYRAVCGVLTNVILNSLLIPAMGIQGAAYATLFSACSSALLFDWFSSKTRHLFYMKLKSPFNHFFIRS